MDLAIDKTRIDFRLSTAYKDMFQQAASYAGFNTLSEFIIYVLAEKSKEILAERQTILASEKDREVFFNALLAPPMPNAMLRDAVAEYNAQLEK